MASDPTPIPAMIERVARAICVADGCDPNQESVGIGVQMPAGQKYRLWEVRVAQARAAIEAMREPTEAMADITGRVLSCGYGHVPDDARIVWQAMIDKALNG